MRSFSFYFTGLVSSFHKGGECYSFLKKNNWDMDKIKTGNLLKRLDDVFVEETRLRIKSQQPRVVKIKTMKKIEASISKVQYQEEVF